MFAQFQTFPLNGPGLPFAVAQDHGAGARRAHDARRVPDLVDGGASDLPHALDDVVEAVDVSLAEQAALRVHRERAAELDVAIFDEVAGLAAPAEAEGLQLQE